MKKKPFPLKQICILALIGLSLTALDFLTRGPLPLGGRLSEQEKWEINERLTSASSTSLSTEEKIEIDTKLSAPPPIEETLTEEQKKKILESLAQ